MLPTKMELTITADINTVFLAATRADNIWHYTINEVVTDKQSLGIQCNFDRLPLQGVPMIPVTVFKFCDQEPGCGFDSIDIA